MHSFTTCGLRGSSKMTFLRGVYLCTSSLRIALFSPSSELSAASGAAARGREANTKMSAASAAFLWNHGTCLREVALAVAGDFFFFFCETSCRSFPAFVRSGRSRCSPTVSYRNGVTLCCSVASASAAQTVGAPRCCCCCPKNRDPCCGCCI